MLESYGLRYAPYVLSILRIMTALLFLEHGLSNHYGWPNPQAVQQMWTLGWWAGTIELVTGALLIVGLFSRCAAFVASGEMAFAYFMSHAPRSFFPINNRGDAAILFCFVFLYIAAAGAGPLSLDAWWRKKA